MANALYDKGRESFLKGEISWSSDNIKVCLVDTGTYTVNLSTHQFHSDLSGVVATSGNLASKTTTAGVADAADLTITGVSGSSIEAIIFWQDTGTSGTSRLIAYVDTATGLAFTPSGGDVILVFDNGANKIFKL